MREVVLKWSGPHSLASREDRQTFSPPAQSGVYLWTVANDAGPKISYVGQAGSLVDRFYEHVFWTLGGAYCLYGREHLIDGSPPEPVYRPSIGSLLTDFWDPDDAYRGLDLARENLAAYRFWGAPVTADRVIRETVESALIDAARTNSQPLQNERVSRCPGSSPCLSVRSVFRDRVGIAALSHVIEYGEL